MQVANTGVPGADALQQREKRANEERQSLLTKKTTLKAIFLSCVLGAALVAGNCFFDRHDELNQNQTEQTISQNGSSLKPLGIFAFMIVGFGALTHLPKVNKRLKSLDRLQQVLSFKPK